MIEPILAEVQGQECGAGQGEEGPTLNVPLP